MNVDEILNEELNKEKNKLEYFYKIEQHIKSLEKAKVELEEEINAIQGKKDEYIKKINTINLMPTVGKKI